MACTMGLVSLSPGLPSGSLSSWSLSGTLPWDHFSCLYSLLLFLSLYSSLFSYHFSIHSVLKYVLKTLGSYCHHSGFFFFLISHRVRRGRVWVLKPKSGLESSLCWARFLTLGKSQSIYASASLALNRHTWVQTSSLSVNMLSNLWNLRANTSAEQNQKHKPLSSIAVAVTIRIFTIISARFQKG